MASAAERVRSWGNQGRGAAGSGLGSSDLFLFFPTLQLSRVLSHPVYLCRHPHRVQQHRGHDPLLRALPPLNPLDLLPHQGRPPGALHGAAAETLEVDLEPLYERIGWPLYRKYGHAFEAFKLIATDPDGVLDVLTYEEKEIGPDGQEVTKVVPAVTPEVKDALVKNIRRRMTPQPLKIRADVEMKCFQFDGVLHIKEAMKKAEAAGNADCPVKIKLVAPPLYVLTTQTLDKEQGIAVLTNATKVCADTIEKHKGKLVVKEAARAVSEKDNKLFEDTIAKLKLAGQEVDGDEDSEEEEDTGMGDVDFTKAGVGTD